MECSWRDHVPRMSGRLPMTAQPAKSGDFISENAKKAMIVKCR